MDSQEWKKIRDELKFGDIVLIKPNNRVNSIKVMALFGDENSDYSWRYDNFDFQLIESSSAFDRSRNLWGFDNNTNIYYRKTKPINKIRKIHNYDVDSIEVIKKLEDKK